MTISLTPRHIIHNADQNGSKNSLVPSHEIIAEQYRIIRKWKPWSDVWPLTIGRSILIGTATLTGIYINHRFRAKLKLRNHGTFPTMLGITLSTASVTALSHTELVLNKILTLDIPCAMCMESTAALMQTCSALFLPMILTPLANFSIAAGSGVYNVPHVTDVRKIFSTILSVYRPLFPKIAMIFTFHSLLAGFITYLEIKSFLRLLDHQYLIREQKSISKDPKVFF